MSAYGLLRNPCLFDPKRTSIPWTPERGIRASWEYLTFVKRYGNQRNGRLGLIHNAIRYHLQKLNIAYLESESVERIFNSRKGFQTAAQTLSDLMRNHTTSMNEWTACVEILEMMIGKKTKLRKAKLPTKGKFRDKKAELQLMSIVRRVRLMQEQKRIKVAKSKC